jgi:hypothetical protein
MRTTPSSWAEILEKASQIAEWSGIAEGIDERFAR